MADLSQYSTDELVALLGGQPSNVAMPLETAIAPSVAGGSSLTDEQRRLAAQTVVGGGALNLGDILSVGLMSKGIAAGQAVGTDLYNLFTGQEPQNTYADELAKIQMMKDISSQAVEQANLGELNTALGFMAPTVGAKGQAIKNLFQARLRFCMTYIILSSRMRKF